jgi:archaellum component FlaG (FlaF/FlaG flagellin family)
MKIIVIIVFLSMLLGICGCNTSSVSSTKPQNFYVYNISTNEVMFTAQAINGSVKQNIDTTSTLQWIDPQGQSHTMTIKSGETIKF